MPARELAPLTYRARQYPLVLASLLALTMISASLPVPADLLRSAREAYLRYRDELKALTANATTRDMAVYRMFSSGASSTLASAVPLLGPVFAALSAAQLGLGVKVVAFAESRELSAVMLSLLLDPSAWLLLLAHSVALVEGAYATWALLRRGRPHLELYASMLVLALALTLVSATLAVAWAP